MDKPSKMDNDEKREDRDHGGRNGTGAVSHTGPTTGPGWPLTLQCRHGPQLLPQGEESLASSMQRACGTEHAPV